MRQHTEPCRECPFRKVSVPAYLGNNDPGTFVLLAYAGARMPCHRATKPKDWDEKSATGPQCVGRADMFANMCKMQRDTEQIKGQRNPNVFRTVQEFAAHHGVEWKIPFFLVSHELLELKEIRDKVPRGGFIMDNQEFIDDAITIIEKNLNEDDVYDMFGENDEDPDSASSEPENFQLIAALLDVVRWLGGEEGYDPPSAGFKEMIAEKA